MRFIVERDVLAEAVAWVARSLPSRPVLPILSGLLLEASSDGLTLFLFRLRGIGPGFSSTPRSPKRAPRSCPGACWPD